MNGIKLDKEDRNMVIHKSKEDARIAGDEITYQHTSQRIAFVHFYSVYRRRY